MRNQSVTRDYPRLDDYIYNLMTEDAERAFFLKTAGIVEGFELLSNNIRGPVGTGYWMMITSNHVPYRVWFSDELEELVDTLGTAEIISYIDGRLKDAGLI